MWWEQERPPGAEVPGHSKCLWVREPEGGLESARSRGKAGFKQAARWEGLRDRSLMCSQPVPKSAETIAPLDKFVMDRYVSKHILLSLLACHRQG